MLKKVRLAFPDLAEPKRFRGEGKPRYSATLLIEKNSENHKACLQALKEAAAEQWGPENAVAAVKAVTAAGKCALKDGATKTDYDGFGDDVMFVAAHAQQGNPPTLLDGARNRLPRDTGTIYAGCYVNASIEFWAMDKKKGFGNQLNAQLRGVQFAADGDAFGAGAPASDSEFDVIEGVETENEEDDFLV
jgi:hypothetical protein